MKGRANGSAADPATLDEAIEALVEAAGSDDKFAKKLGTSRQTVIRWRLHGVFPEKYVEQLRAEGVPEWLLGLRPLTPREVEDHLREIEAEIAEIRSMNDPSLQGPRAQKVSRKLAQIRRSL